ncbi:Hsp20/alpha crystallin family protein [Limnoraphis robusta]|uniref:Hsp20/alpha crystallin family protein n=1 Tax=Limnoraphis robusta CCNP1315 TaxID=3110306 RepID=A0ABU5U6V8_9CYAN|nr:Hsp20/alpha crystallin family protein [Limnoraphis robusta]MEA5522899.1 Hsp20/alpha crystallin family protein [Limnoraphis robusta CCNP1315]MEA5546839.1 Hsp20/alpha crystallin family protein [Limnoraphis robusta CCNP1324]
MMLAYNAFAEMERMQRQFDRVLNSQVTSRWNPAIELQETPDSYVLRAFLPGLDSAALNIEAAKKAIAISGKTHRPELDEGHKYLYSEFPSGEFRRVVNLPEAIAHTEVKADYVDGVLTLTMPKAPETVNRVVKVSLNSVEQPQLSEVEQ